MKPLTPSQLKKMTQQARAARANAYAPYSSHPVGVALLDAKGRLYIGANCETANYDGNCAEHAAIAAMTTAGGRGIRAVVVIGPAGDYLCTPCGRCRQRIREFSNVDTVIYSLWHDGRVGAIHGMDDLLPQSFGPENLGRAPASKKRKKK